MMLQRPDEFFVAIIFVLRLRDVSLDAVSFDAAFGTLRIDIRGERVEWILEEDGFRLRRLELAKDAGTAVSDIAPILFLFLLFQLDRRQVDDGICIAGEDARAAAAVGRSLSALRALGVMVAVDDRASQLAADVVELIAKVRHIAGGILVARDDLVNRVDVIASRCMSLHRRTMIFASLSIGSALPLRSHTMRLLELGCIGMPFAR